jgi:hypothetical protein
MKTFIPRHIAKSLAESAFRHRWSLENRPKATSLIRRVALALAELECTGFEMFDETKVTCFGGGEPMLRTFFHRIEDLGHAYYMERITSVQFYDGVLSAGIQLAAFTDHPKVKGN